MLPKLNEIPKYKCTIPSSGKTVRFRPYLVSEEKVLMMFQESGDIKNALDSIIDLVKNCIDGVENEREFTTFDIDYLFLQIRSKSVGEVSQLGLSCKHCEKTNEISVRLDDVEVVRDKIVEKEIELEENITLTMRYPNFNDVIKFEDDKLTETEKTFMLISKCMESIETEEENIMLKDVSNAEVNEFIESLNTEQFTKVREYVENMPRVEKEIKYVCGSCETENTVVLSGIDDFF